MTARPPQIHQSALSPAEWDAYQPLLESFFHQFGDSNLEPNKVWEWLRGRLQDESVATREKEFLSFFRNVPSSSLSASHTLLALLRLASHSQRNSLLTRDHLFIQTDPISLAPVSSQPSSNPFLSSDWCQQKRRSSLITPPSSLPSPTSPLSPNSHSSKPKPNPTVSNNPFLLKSSASNSAFVLSPPPLTTTPSTTSQPPTVPTRQSPSTSPQTNVPRPNLPPPRRSSTLTSQRSVSTSTIVPVSPGATTITPSPAPPLPIRRSVSLSHAPHSDAPPLPTPLVRSSTTVTRSRPPPPAPPPKATKPSTPSTSARNPHIGLEDSLGRRSSGSTFPQIDALVSEGNGRRSRKNSLVRTGGEGTSRSRSGSLTSLPPNVYEKEYTYSPIASSSTLTTPSKPLSKPVKPSEFAGFTNSSIILPLPPRQPLSPPPPPSHPNRRKSSQHVQAKSDPFSNPPTAAKKSVNASSGVTRAMEEASNRIRNVFEDSQGPLNLSRRVSGKRSCVTVNSEERDGLMRSNEEDEEGEADAGPDELEEQTRDEEVEERSESEDEEADERSLKGERRKEVDREARRRDELGQWTQLS